MKNILNVLVLTVFVLCAVCPISSCSNEYSNIVKNEEEQQDEKPSMCEVVPLTVAVNNGVASRATADDNLNTAFQQGDRLFGWAYDEQGNTVGVAYLCITDGVGTAKATFKGGCVYRDNNPSIASYRYELLNADSEGFDMRTVGYVFYSWDLSDEVKQWPFPTGLTIPARICTDLADAVKNFGLFSCQGDATELPTDITLAQEKSFVTFKLTFDENTGISVGDDVELSCMYTTDRVETFPAYQTTASADGKAIVKFVLPMDYHFNKAQIIIPRPETPALAVKFGKAENTLAPGTVYKVEKTVTKDNKLQLNKNMPDGIIGEFEGVDAIIVDLGSELGRRIFELKNADAESFEAPGTMESFIRAINGPWNIPSQKEFRALFESGYTWNAIRKGVEFKFNISGFSTQTTLFIPAAGYKDYDGSMQEEGVIGYYWTSSRLDPELGDGAFALYFGENGFQIADFYFERLFGIRRLHSIDDIE